MITFLVRFIILACVPSLAFLAVRVAIVERRERAKAVARRARWAADPYGVKAIGDDLQRRVDAVRNGQA